MLEEAAPMGSSSVGELELCYAPQSVAGTSLQILLHPVTSVSSLSFIVVAFS